MIFSILNTRRLSACLLATVGLLLTACGGGGSSQPANAVQNPTQPATPPPATPAPSAFTPGEFEPFGNFEAQCVNPRNSNGFNDTQGDTTTQNSWLRSWSNDLYLWYNEIVDANPANFTTPEYFELMRTTATTPSGAPRDQFHFSIDTEEWLLQSQSGISAGYGFDIAILSATPPRDIAIAFVEPNSPATGPDVNLARGTRILQVDGLDAVNGNTAATVDALNAGLFPSTTGESHTFIVQDEGSATTREITLVTKEVTTDPVQNVRVIDTANGPVGYLTFNTHIATAEDELFDAFTTLANASVSELVLDLRYNGGGFLVLANQVASMITGPAVAGLVFDEIQFNDKHTVRDPVTGANLSPDTFLTTSPGLPGSLRGGQVLPALNLNRVFVLSGPGTCSASESIINGLRGIDIDVVLIGDTTCGKPYGFYPTDNCGETYFTVQFRSVNAKNFGDYADGFSPANLPGVASEAIPGCAVADDFSKQLGDPEEARLAAALGYISDGSCPAPNLALGANASDKKAGGQKSVSSQSQVFGNALVKPVRMPGAVRSR